MVLFKNGGALLVRRTYSLYSAKNPPRCQAENRTFAAGRRASQLATPHPTVNLMALSLYCVLYLKVAEDPGPHVAVAAPVPVHDPSHVHHQVQDTEHKNIKKITETLVFMHLENGIRHENGLDGG
jgi:hypothetical protein